MACQNAQRRFPRKRYWPTLAIATTGLFLASLQAMAHQLTVFATVENGAAKITAKFADGTDVSAGRLKIYSAEDTLVLSQDMSGAWPVYFPVEAHLGGLRIEVDAGNGHSNYWILTPGDMMP